MDTPERLTQPGESARPRAPHSRQRPDVSQPKHEYTQKHSSARAILIALACTAIAVLLVTPTLTLQADEGPVSGIPAPVTIVVSVDGHDATLPILVAGQDFELGEPVRADPRFMVDESGAQLLSSLVEEKEAQGLSLVWHDQNGSPFDWFETPVTEPVLVKGTFVEVGFEVRVSFDDGATEDTVVQVPKGSSYAQAAGGVPESPAKKGHVFKGWVDASTGASFDFNAPVCASTTVFAKWEISEPDQVVAVDPTADVPKTISGTCWIGATWNVNPAKFSISGFDGYLKGCSGTGTCSLPSAAAPRNTRASYTATLTRVDIEHGEIHYDVHITPPGAAHKDGPRNSFGLIGYQTVSFQAVVQKNFGGYIQVSKESLNPEISEGLATYSYEGATFAVYDKNGSCVERLTTGADGKTAKSRLLPIGTYTIREEQAPEGYAPADDIGVTVQSGHVATATFADAPQRANIEGILHKVDRETGEQLPLGAATLEGAHFRIDYYDCHADLTDISSEEQRQEIAEWGEPVRSWTLRTDTNGTLSFSEDNLVKGDAFFLDEDGSPCLPLGTVVIQETTPPVGYLPSNELIVRDLRPSGTNVYIEAWHEATFPEQVCRGDLSFTKAAAGTMRRLADVPFAITSKTTGESHLLVTDDNGMANTSANWVPHSQGTNAGTTWRDGIWFGIDTEGTKAPVNDTLGALPYDTYVIEEQPCKSNEGYELVTFEITIARENTVLDLGTVDNDRIGLEISGDVDKREIVMDTTGAFSYTLDYRSTSNTWVDEYNLVDTITCAVEEQAYLTSITTPVTFEDWDGLMNVWYRTNLDSETSPETADDTSENKPNDKPDNEHEADQVATASDESSGGGLEPPSSEESGSGKAPNACASNPPSEQNPENERIRDYSGWRVWTTDVSTLSATELSVEDLGLEDGEYVVAFAFEHGRVEAGFGTNAPETAEWDRHGRYDSYDLVDDIGTHETSFDTAEALGPTSSQGVKTSWAPAVIHMQAYPEILSAPEAVDLWNDAEIDIHRDLELHDEDKDAVVQSTDPVETTIEHAKEQLQHLPKTADGLFPVAGIAAALAGTAGLFTWRYGPGIVRRHSLRQAVRRG